MVQIGGHGCFAAPRSGKRSESACFREHLLLKTGCCRVLNRRSVSFSSI